MDNYTEDEIFNNINFKPDGLPNGEYEYCKFINCDFSDTSFSYSKFLECEFINCNLSMVSLSGVSFRNVVFKDCKMIGLKFDECNEFGIEFSFENCILDYSSFYQLEIPETVFKNSQLHEVDFTECNLRASVFDNCDLNMVRFIDAVIEYADFTTSYNYSIDLDLNKVKKAKFSLSGLSGLLDKYNIDIK